ncbi:MAG: hypothetical protein MRZ79_19525 [Bacteroidia bacterium]|nr:hypothetical protein [Bacteroidia bacterium]
MKTYTVNLRKFRASHMTRLKSQGKYLLVAVLVGISIPLVNVGFSGSAILPLAISLLLGLVALYAGVRQSLNYQERLMKSYSLQTDGENFVSYQEETQSIRISKEQISAVVEDIEGNLIIISESNNLSIKIPAHVNSRRELVEVLGKITPIHTQPEDQAKRQAYIGIFSVVLMGLVFILKEPTIVVPGGIILIGLLLWSYNEIQKSTSVDRKTKRLMNLAFIPMGATLIKILSMLAISWGIM